MKTKHIGMLFFFAAKAQKEIDALWDNGTINEDPINQWGAEHMRTPYRYVATATSMSSSRLIGRKSPS